MRRWIVRIILIFLAVVIVVAGYVWISLQPPRPIQPTSDAFVISDVTVIHPGVSRLESVTVAVSDGRFVHVFDSAGASSKPALEELGQFKGAYVLPGLVDMHGHLPPDNVLRLTPYFLLLNLAHGVTTLRCAGDVDGTANPAAKKGIASGAFPGPRLYTSGPFVAAGEPRWANTRIIHGPEEAEDIVREIKAEGNAFIKAYENLTPEMIRALVEACQKHKMGVFGHVPFELAYEDALVPDVQHFLGVPRPENLSEDSVLARISEWQTVDDVRMQRIVDASLEHHIANTPTLVSTSQLLLYRNYDAALVDPNVQLAPAFFPQVVWHPKDGLKFYRSLDAAYLDNLERALAKKMKLVRVLHEAGLRLHLGTDSQQPFVVPGIALQQEMQLFHQTGISAQDVWALATTKAYAAIGDDQIGAIEEGQFADALVFREDPTASLDALGTLEAVILRGQLYTRESLDQKIAEYQEHYRSFPVGPLSKFLARQALRRATNGD